MGCCNAADVDITSRLAADPSFMARIKSSNNAMGQLDDVHVNAAITEAQTGRPMRMPNGTDHDHVTDVQGGIDSLNRTLNHLERTLKPKYAGSAADLSAINRVERFYKGVINDVRKSFRAGGVENRINW
jgi:hypothetical protein